ncbi:hypothetical protein QQ045_009737 [Rhodiola kirilowii]
MTALVERWRSETHTFHLRNGEMTITLEDVGILTGLLIEGRAVTTHQEVGDYRPLCLQFLGVIPHGKRLTTVRRMWLREHMQNVPADATDVEVQRYARAYILAMLGSSLFPDSSGSEISLHFLPLLADLDSLLSYSWGGAVLANLYRNMCNACESKATQLSGCVILLQLWAWEHMITGRPRMLAQEAQPLDSDIDPALLLALGYKWKVPKSFMHTSHHVLMLYRDLLDRQEANDVIWAPYTDAILAPLNPICLDGRESWRAEVASLVRTCKMSASMFFKTTDKEVKGQLHDMFHATRADLLKIGEGRALDVDVTQIHLLSDSDEDIDLPHDTFDVGPSQVTQAESQRSPSRRVSTRARKTTQRFTPSVYR